MLITIGQLIEQLKKYPSESKAIFWNRQNPNEQSIEFELVGIETRFFEQEDYANENAKEIYLNLQ